MRAQRGISLIEVVAALVVIGLVAGYALPRMQLAGRAMLVNDQVLTASQYAQACAEHILQQRRDEPTYGLVSVTSTSCNSIPVLTNYSLVVTVTSVTSAADTVCASSVECKKVKVTAQYQGGAKATIDLMLPKY